MKCEKRFEQIFYFELMTSYVCKNVVLQSKHSLEFIPKLSTMFLPEFLKKMKECVIASVHNNTYLAMHS